MTVLDIINRALRLLGVSQSGEAGDASEVNDAFKALNLLIGEWNNEKLMLHYIVNNTFALTAGKGTYSIGTGGEINTTRPIKIDKAFVRFTPNDATTAYDFPLEIISNDKYEDIFMKSIQVTYPLYLFYNPSYPLGEIRLWPMPNNVCSLGISQWQQLSAFTSLTAEINLPPGYETAFAYNLAVEMMSEYGKADQLIIDKADETKQKLMEVNFDLAPMKTDPALNFPRGFNILSGSYR